MTSKQLTSFLKQLLLLSLCLTLSQQKLYECINESFNVQCKTNLYACTNNPECSYQLHQNTKQNFLNQNSANFVAMYFSNALARELYECLRKQCDLPALDEEYPKKLALDYCMFEVYDICGGDIDFIYKNPSSTTPEALCYKKYCQSSDLEQNRKSY